MKSRFFAALVAVVIALCVFSSVACNKDKQKGNEYVPLTLEQFKANAEEFTQLTNYLSATGYKLELEAQSTIDNVESGYTICAILNLQDTTDVQLSVNFNSTNGGTIPGVLEGVLSVPKSINVYMYNHTLYADIDTGIIPQKDSMPVDNDLTSIISNVINGDMSLPGVGNLSVDDIEAMLEYFDDYLTITYCEKLGHYILDLDYTGGTYDGQNIDPFTLKVELYVSSERITSVSLDFDSDEAKARGTLIESTEAIKRPTNEGSYNGLLFELLEGIFKGNSGLPSDPSTDTELPDLDDILGMLPDGLLDSIISGMVSGELQGDLQSLLEAYPGLSELFETYPELEEFLNDLFSGELFPNYSELRPDLEKIDVDLTPEEMEIIEDYFNRLDLEGIAYERLLRKLEKYFLPNGVHNIMD